MHVSMSKLVTGQLIFLWNTLDLISTFSLIKFECICVQTQLNLAWDFKQLYLKDLYFFSFRYWVQIIQNQSVQKIH